MRVFKAEEERQFLGSVSVSYGTFGTYGTMSSLSTLCSLSTYAEMFRAGFPSGQCYIASWPVSYSTLCINHFFSFKVVIKGRLEQNTLHSADSV